MERLRKFQVRENFISQGTQTLATHFIARKPVLLDECDTPSTAREYQRGNATRWAGTNDEHIGHIFIVARVFNPFP
jgi:hypothetical protein